VKNDHGVKDLFVPEERSSRKFLSRKSHAAENPWQGFQRDAESRWPRAGSRPRPGTDEEQAAEGHLSARLRIS